MHGAEVNVYSLSRDGATLITPHFRAREFRCKDGSDAIFVANGLVQVLEQVRCHFDKPVIITSAYRTEGHNRKAGGKPHSQHKYGLAADIQVRGISPAAVADYVETLMPDTGGIGRYRSFTHIDVRKQKARW